MYRLCRRSVAFSECFGFYVWLDFVVSVSLSIGSHYICDVLRGVALITRSLLFSLGTVLPFLSVVFLLMLCSVDVVMSYL